MLAPDIIISPDSKSCTPVSTLIRVDSDKQAYVDEGIFAHGADVDKVTVNGTDYTVTEVTEDVINGRAY